MNRWIAGYVFTIHVWDLSFVSFGVVPVDPQIYHCATATDDTHFINQLIGLSVARYSGPGDWHGPFASFSIMRTKLQGVETIIDAMKILRSYIWLNCMSLRTACSFVPLGAGWDRDVAARASNDAGDGALAPVGHRRGGPGPGGLSSSNSTLSSCHQRWR